MSATRKLYAQGELIWWLGLLTLALLLLCVLAREARGTRYESRCPRLTTASPHCHSVWAPHTAECAGPKLSRLACGDVRAA
jgi:hypothetical protein